MDSYYGDSATAETIGERDVTTTEVLLLQGLQLMRYRRSATTAVCYRNSPTDAAIFCYCRDDATKT